MLNVPWIYCFLPDIDPDVRRAILGALGPQMDFHLAQAEYIRILLIALHDEVIENRILAIQVVGRLATHNPFLTLPQLKRTVTRLLTELKCALNS